jgi:hypothetical protein
MDAEQRKEHTAELNRWYKDWRQKCPAPGALEIRLMPLLPDNSDDFPGLDGLRKKPTRSLSNP